MVTNRLLRSGQRPVWHLVDAKGQVVGRLATQIAALLSGKHKPVMRRNDLCGDVVVVVNASEVVFTGKKETDKVSGLNVGFNHKLISVTSSLRPTRGTRGTPEDEESEPLLNSESEIQRKYCDVLFMGCYQRTSFESI